MRGVFALFLGTGLSPGVKAMIFDLSVGSGAISGTLRGSCTVAIDARDGLWKLF